MAGESPAKYRPIASNTIHGMLLYGQWSIGYSFMVIPLSSLPLGVPDHVYIYIILMKSLFTWSIQSLELLTLQKSSHRPGSYCSPQISQKIVIEKCWDIRKLQCQDEPGKNQLCLGRSRFLCLFEEPEMCFSQTYCLADRKLASTACAKKSADPAWTRREILLYNSYSKVKQFSAGQFMWQMHHSSL